MLEVELNLRIRYRYFGSILRTQSPRWCVLILISRTMPKVSAEVKDARPAINPNEMYESPITELIVSHGKKGFLYDETRSTSKAKKSTKKCSGKAAGPSHIRQRVGARNSSPISGILSQGCRGTSRRLQISERAHQDLERHDDVPTAEHVVTCYWARGCSLLMGRGCHMFRKVVTCYGDRGWHMLWTNRLSDVTVPGVASC